jgi:hypothetical protein
LTGFDDRVGDEFAKAPGDTLAVRGALACARLAVGMIRPLVRARWLTFVVAGLLSLLMWVATWIILALWTGTLVEEWSPVVAASSAPASAAFESGSYVLRERTFAETWSGWHQDAAMGWFGIAELIAVLIAAGTIVLLALAALLNLPLVHATGHVGRSYGRSFRAATSLLWPATLLTLVAGSLLVPRILASRHVVEWPSAAFVPPRVVLAISVFYSLPLLVVWLRCAAAAGRSTEPADDEPPRCEYCGYDLTHQPEERRCPECGSAIDDSLDEARSRPGSRWAAKATRRSWWADSAVLLLRPQAFYRRLKLRTPPHAEHRFAFWSYIGLSCAALVWAYAMMAYVFVNYAPPSRWEFPAIVVGGIGATLTGVCGCWLGHRVLAALVFVLWIAHRGLADFRYAAKVVACESVFLWVFCGYWGVLATSFALDPLWLTRLTAYLIVYSPPRGAVENLAILGGTLVLATVWCMRYRAAYAAIRWSNY